MAYTDVDIINVGAGSCALIESPSGRVSMVDINDSDDLREAVGMDFVTRFLSSEKLAKEKEKLESPIGFCKANGIDSLHRFVLSHPDADHMAGLRRVLGGELPALNFWDVPNDKDTTEFTNDDAREDWQMYQKLRNGQLADGPKYLKPVRGDAREYWIDDDIEILSPGLDLIQDCGESSDWNNLSYVIRIRHGMSSVMLPGDVEDRGWRDMLDTGLSLKSDVLVASHHGRQSGYLEEAVEAIAPSIVVVSTAEVDPKHDAEDEYRKHTDSVYSTRDHGTLWIRMADDNSFELWSQAGRLERWTR